MLRGRLTDKIPLGKINGFGKDGRDLDIFTYDNKEMPDQLLHSSFYDIINKLGYHEDIEEEIGIDLFTKDRVEKAETIYHYSNGEMKICAWFRTHIYLEINDCWSNYTLEYKEYGKTWALTKEELEYYWERNKI